MSEDLYTGPTMLAPGAPKPSVRGQKIAQAVFIPLILILLAVLLLFYGLFSTAVVDGTSMVPTLRDQDRVLITHGLKNPRRGDVVVLFAFEGGARIELVKRIIGLAGDTVEIRNDVAYVNGVAEPQRGQIVNARFSLSEPALRIPPGNVYVLGDNRPVSEDSRYIGTVRMSGIKGKVVAVFAPITNAHVVR